METPKTLQDAIIYFADAEDCRRFMVAVRWADGVVRCPACGSDKVTWLANAKVYKCRTVHPKQKFSLKTGTVFEDSPIALEKWLPAVWMLSNCRNGVSSYEIARSIGVTQKSAWFMLQRIRLAMQDGFTGGKLVGNIEMDETFVGGKAKNMHKSKLAKMGSHLKNAGSGTFKGKTIVVGMLERKGRVKAEVVEARTREVLHDLAAQHIAPDATIITDEHHPYRGISLTHEVINHAEGYVRGHIHTNGIENFWSCLKRTLGGTYVSVEPFHLFRYIDEQSFRFNNRGTNDAGRFAKTLSGVQGKRLTFAEVTGRGLQAQA